MRADKGLGALQAVSTFRDEALVQGQQAENTGVSIILTSVHSVGRDFRLEEVNHKDQELSALPRPAHAEGDHTEKAGHCRGSGTMASSFARRRGRTYTVH